MPTSAGKINLKAIAEGKGPLLLRPFWGTGRGYLDKLLRDHGIEVETIHDWRDVTFGGQAPEPGEEHIGELIRAGHEQKDTRSGSRPTATLTDLGSLTATDEFITPNRADRTFDRLSGREPRMDRGSRQKRCDIASGRPGRERNAALRLHETPVGFKFIGELINKDEIILGGEESAGLSIQGHYPEKDGILACLLAIEAVTVRQATLTEQLDELYQRVGKLENARIGVKLTPDVAAKLKEKLGQEPTELAGRKIDNINRIDGVKFLFADQTRWMLMRPSGTEPLVRIYAESETIEDVNTLLEAGKQYFLS